MPGRLSDQKLREFIRLGATEESPVTLRREALRIATGLPKGDETRRAILGALQQSDRAGREDMTRWPDAEKSDKWQAPQVLTKGVDGWIVRTDYYPHGITLKPGVDPDKLKREVGRQTGAKPRDIRLVVNPRMASTRTAGGAGSLQDLYYVAREDWLNRIGEVASDATYGTDTYFEVLQWSGTTLEFTVYGPDKHGPRGALVVTFGRAGYEDVSFEFDSPHEGVPPQRGVWRGAYTYTPEQFYRQFIKPLAAG